MTGWSANCFARKMRILGVAFRNTDTLQQIKKPKTGNKSQEQN
jgi:hypothetical protein